MACDTSIYSLQTRNVNASKQTQLDLRTLQDGYELSQPNMVLSCVDATRPFATFCNIPQPTDDPMQSMCSLSLQTLDPNSFLQELIRGSVSSLDQLSSLWESALISQTPGATWSTIENSTLFEPLDASGDVFLGFNLFNVVDMACANGTLTLLLMRGGYLYYSADEGFIRQVVNPDPDIPNQVIFGDDLPNQAVTASAFGSICAALFANKFYFYGNQTWQLELSKSLPLRNVIFQSMKLWENVTRGEIFVAILYQGTDFALQRMRWCVDVFAFVDSDTENNPLAFIEPIKRILSPIEDLTSFRLGFLTIQPNNELLVWSTFVGNEENPKILQIHTVNTLDYTDVQIARWSATEDDAWFADLQNGTYIAALIDNNLDAKVPENTITMFLVCKKNMFELVLNFNQVVSQTRVRFPGVPPRTLHLSESIDHSRRLFNINGILRTSASLDTIIIPDQPFSLNDENLIDAYVFALSPDASQIWIIRNHTIYRLINEISGAWGTAWIHTFPMYFAIEATVSDFGLPRLPAPLYVPSSSTWYMGTVKRATESLGPSADITIPFEAARSMHETFRYVVTDVRITDANGALDTFPYAIGELQRANEFILSQLASSVEIQNDSNVVMRQGDTILWQSNTHDQISVQDGQKSPVASLRQIPFAISSNNGLYILYVNQQQRLRCVFNPFNAFRMTQWCEVDIDRFHQALDMQTEFCWSQLHKPLTPDFADLRCTCIGDKRLFEIVAPKALGTPSSLSGPLAETLPCYIAGCSGGSNGRDDTPTNVLRFVTSRCSNRLINVCKDVSKITDSNVPFVKYTNCGIEREQCESAQDCDSGNMCLNGQCTLQCKSDEQCAAVYGLRSLGCIDGACIPKPSAFFNSPSAFTQWWTIVGIICVILVVLVVLVFVGLITKTKLTT